MVDLYSQSLLAVTPSYHKSMVCIMHVNLNFPFKLGFKVGLHIIHKCAYYSQIFMVVSHNYLVAMYFYY